MYWHIVSKHVVLTDEEIESSERTPWQAYAEDAPNKDKGKGKTDNDDD